MKIALRISLFLVLFFGLERLIRTQTCGFRIDKTIAEYPYNPSWELGETPLPKELNQPFYFLGSGAQTYSFIGQDQTTVLKLFKHYHCWPSSRVLKKLPGSWKAIAKREERMKSIFDSVLLAYKKLPQETQIFHLSLIPKLSHPSIVIYDKIGIRYIIDLKQTPFVLQKKVQPLYPYLQEHPDEAKAIISSFFACLRHRNSLGIANSDNHVGRNFGVWENKVVQFDIGSYFLGEPSEQNSAEFEQWIIKNRPDLKEYFHENRL
ncbi:MAG: hypothetical protein JSS30_08060 [Verrucomicrobia bacterium]|nr:hypothetical protein [Verrucomicrobiota bacterium]